MFVAAIIKALLLTQVPVLAEPTGTGQDGAQVAAVADNILTRQLLVLDGETPLIRRQNDEELKQIIEDPQTDEAIDLISLKNGMQAHVSPATLDEDETSNWDSPAFPSGPARNDLGPRIFLSVPTEPEGDYGESNSVL
ncbi:hypothetical protein F5883DRAFT_521798 [Diaporthe sp. PMI_573]|nr:hypothetical protein F5883DRAFT_521798 [Diaporthaceae sp. PMI_573]